MFENSIIVLRNVIYAQVYKSCYLKDSKDIIMFNKRKKMT